MDIEKLPQNKRTTIIAEKFIIAVVDRISREEAIISYINLKTREEVLRILQRIDGSQILQYLDEGYWDIYADGKLITNYDLSFFKDLEVKVNVSTSDKSLEIISFNNRKVPVKKNDPVSRILKG